MRQSSLLLSPPRTFRHRGVVPSRLGQRRTSQLAYDHAIYLGDAWVFGEIPHYVRDDKL
jgi:hypothetical protein